MQRASRFTDTVNGAHFDGEPGTGGFHRVTRGPEKGPFDAGCVLKQVSIDFGDLAARTWLVTCEGPQGIDIIAQNPGGAPVSVQTVLIPDLDYEVSKGAIVKVVTGGVFPAGVAYASISVRGGTAS